MGVSVASGTLRLPTYTVEGDETIQRLWEDTMEGLNFAQA